MLQQPLQRGLERPLNFELAADAGRSRTPEHADLKRWYGGDFDPNTPDSDEFRLEVLKLAKRWKPKKKTFN